MKTTIKQKYSLAIRDAATGKVKDVSAWRENLILDAGLTSLANGTGMAPMFERACIGSSNAANAIASGAVTFSQVGTAILASANFFTSGMTGALMKFGVGSGGSEVYLTFIDATHATASISQTVIAGTVATVYFVQQTKLANWTYNFDRYTNGNQTTANLSGGVLTVTHQRVFVFNQKAAPYTVNEIGWGSDVLPNPNINGRAVLPAPVSIGVNDFVVLTIQLIFTITPTAQQVTFAADQLFDQYKGTASTAPKFMLETYGDFSHVNGDGTSAGGLDTGSNLNLGIITSNSFVQNTDPAATPNAAPGTIYAIQGGAGHSWQQVGGQVPGVSQYSSSGSANTGGENLYGVGLFIGFNSFMITCAPHYFGGSPSALPTGNFQMTATWQWAWTRQLSN